MTIYPDELYARLANTAKIESVAYVDGEAVGYLNKCLSNRDETVLDKLKLLKDSVYNDIVRDCMQYNRLELYHDINGNIVGVDDKLLELLLRKVPLDNFRAFFDEIKDWSQEAQNLFKAGKVVFMSTNGQFHVHEKGKQYYCYTSYDTSDIIKSDRFISGPKWIPAENIVDVFNDFEKASDFMLKEDEELVTTVVDKLKCYKTIWQLLLNSDSIMDDDLKRRMKLLYSLLIKLLQGNSFELTWGSGIEDILTVTFSRQQEKTHSYLMMRYDTLPKRIGNCIINTEIPWQRRNERR